MKELPSPPRGFRPHLYQRTAHLLSISGSNQHSPPGVWSKSLGYIQNLSDPGLSGQDLQLIVYTRCLIPVVSIIQSFHI